MKILGKSSDIFSNLGKFEGHLAKHSYEFESI